VPNACSTANALQERRACVLCADGDHRHVIPAHRLRAQAEATAVSDGPAANDVRQVQRIALQRKCKAARRRPHPRANDIASDPQDEPAEITQDEFEKVWAQRHDRT